MKRGFSLCSASFWLAGGVFAAAVLIAGSNLVLSADATDEPGTTLVFEPDPDKLIDPNQLVDSASLDRIVGALKKRIGTQKVSIRRVETGRIEVRIASRDAATVQRIRHLLERPGTIEFRILANTRDHKDIIDRALRENSLTVRSTKKDENGEYPIVARWIPLQEGKTEVDKKRVQAVLGYPEIAARTVKNNDAEVRQVLVVEDYSHVTGQYLKQASADRDSRDKPCVSFRFNEEGGRRFATLTGNYLPEQANEEGLQFTRKLGIIIDGRLYSAPAIRSTISDRGQISGEFTKEEVQDLVSVLNAGSLPAAIKLVKKSVGEAKEP